VDGFVEGGLVDVATAPGDGDDLFLTDAGSSYLADWWIEHAAEDDGI
jgi:hypothetical protein